MLLEQKLANKEKEEEAKQTTVEEYRKKVTIGKEKTQSVSSDSGTSMEIPDKEKVGKTIDPKFKEVMHEPKHRSSQIISHKRENNMIVHGMAEDVSICDTDKVQDIFDAVQAKYEP